MIMGFFFSLYIGLVLFGFGVFVCLFMGGATFFFFFFGFVHTKFSRHFFWGATSVYLTIYFSSSISCILVFLFFFLRTFFAIISLRGRFIIGFHEVIRVLCILGRDNCLLRYFEDCMWSTS